MIFDSSANYTGHNDPLKLKILSIGKSYTVFTRSIKWGVNEHNKIYNSYTRLTLTTGSEPYYIFILFKITNDLILPVNV